MRFFKLREVQKYNRGPSQKLTMHLRKLNNFSYHILVHNMVGQVWSIKKGKFREKCLMFPVQDEFALTGHRPEVYLNWPLLSLWTLHLLVNYKQEQQRKGKETEGVYRLVEGTRMRVVEPKSWTFPKWKAQHNNAPHLGLMDAFNACAVKYMCVCGIFIYLYSLITGEIPNKVHACAYIVCWYVVWQHRVRTSVCVCECVRVLKRAQTARRQQSALPVTAERRQKTERAREREICISLW